MVKGAIDIANDQLCESVFGPLQGQVRKVLEKFMVDIDRRANCTDLKHDALHVNLLDLEKRMKHQE
eukprot:4170095-Karenia_brevis.AAC.1